MAAVTQNSFAQNVSGSYRQGFYNVDIASSGDTLATPFRVVKSMTVNDVAVTKLAFSSGTITFTTTGAVTGALVNVEGL